MKKKIKSKTKKITKRKTAKRKISKTKRKSSRKNPPSEKAGYADRGMWVECLHCYGTGRTISSVEHTINCPKRPKRK